jgi:hypothetical protein
LRSRSHGVGGSEISLRNLFEFADDVVTVRGAHEATLLCIRKTKQDTKANPIFREAKAWRTTRTAFKDARFGQAAAFDAY